MPTTRRGLLRQAGCAATVVATAGVGGFPTILRAAEPITVTYARAEGGVSSVVDEYMAAKRFDLKHGVNIKTINSYVSIPSYYADLDGRYLRYGYWRVGHFLPHVPQRSADQACNDGHLRRAHQFRYHPERVEQRSVISRARAWPRSAGSGSLAMFTVLLNKETGIEVGKRRSDAERPEPLHRAHASGRRQCRRRPVLGALHRQHHGEGKHVAPDLQPGRRLSKMTGETLPYFSCVLRNEVLARNPDVGPPRRGRDRRMYRRHHGPFAGSVSRWQHQRPISIPKSASKAPSRAVGWCSWASPWHRRKDAR